MLARRGIGPETTVGLAIPRSPRLDRGACSPYCGPAPRTCRWSWTTRTSGSPTIVDDARPDAILTVSARGRHRLTGELIELDRPAARGGAVRRRSRRTTRTGCGHPAYTIYTSGSTGKPKGVVTEYAGLTNMLINHQRRIFEPVARASTATGSSGSRTPCRSRSTCRGRSCSWLADGHEVHICDEELRRDAPRLVEYCVEHGIDVINVTPTYAQQLVAEGLLDDPARRPGAGAAGR